MKFTIAIPAYKARYLKECIDSVLAQTVRDFELIIVNDASPEDIDSVVNSYTDSRIRYYTNEVNFGAEHVVDNWNKCLSYARGEYFVLFGDDDLMEPNYLEEFALLIDKYPTLDVFHCSSYIINELSEKIEISPSWPEFETVYENIWHRISVKRLQFISDFVYKTSTLKDNNGFYKQPLAWASDDISSYIAANKKGIAHTNKAVFCYRRNSSTISNTGSIDLKLKAIKLEIEWIKNLNNDIPENFNDKIIQNNILDYLSVYHNKKRILTISNYMKLGFFKGASKVLLLSDFNLKEKGYVILTYFKKSF